MRITGFNIGKHHQRRDKWKSRAKESPVLDMDDAIVMMAMNYAMDKQSNTRKKESKDKASNGCVFRREQFLYKDCLYDFCFKPIHIGIISERCKFIGVSSQNE